MPFLSPLHRHVHSNIHFDVVLSVFIHPSKKAEESSVFAQSLRSCLCACASDVCVRALQMCVCTSDVCVRALQMCARETSHTGRDSYSFNPERLLCSSRAFVQSLY